MADVGKMQYLRRRKAKKPNPLINQLKEDEFVVMMGRLQLDHFSGGLRVKVQQVWDLRLTRRYLDKRD